MSKRVSRLFGFNASTSADVASYLLVVGPAKNTDGSDHVLDLDTDTVVDIGIPDEREVNGETLLVVGLDTIPEVQALPEGDYDVGVAAKDNVGNISDINEAEDVTLDITPPEAPTGAKVFSAP